MTAFKDAIFQKVHAEVQGGKSVVEAAKAHGVSENGYRIWRKRQSAPVSIRKHRIAKPSLIQIPVATSKVRCALVEGSPIEVAQVLKGFLQ